MDWVVDNLCCCLRRGDYERVPDDDVHPVSVGRVSELGAAISQLESCLMEEKRGINETKEGLEKERQHQQRLDEELSYSMDVNGNAIRRSGSFMRGKAVELDAVKKKVAKLEVILNRRRERLQDVKSLYLAALETKKSLQQEQQYNPFATLGSTTLADQQRQAESALRKCQTAFRMLQSNPAAR